MGQRRKGFFYGVGATLLGAEAISIPFVIPDQIPLPFAANLCVKFTFLVFLFASALSFAIGCFGEDAK